MKIKPTAAGVVVELEHREAQIPSPEPKPATLPLFKLRKILVPVDFTHSAGKALQYAVPFAKQFGAELLLLHVIEPYVPPSEMAPYLGGETTEDAEHYLEILRKGISPDVAVTTLVRRGIAEHEILGAIHQLRIDLVILATHGRRGLERMLMGSTTEKVIRQAGCPVLIVREHEHEFVTATAAHETLPATSIR